MNLCDVAYHLAGIKAAAWVIAAGVAVVALVDAVASIVGIVTIWRERR